MVDKVQATKGQFLHSFMGYQESKGIFTTKRKPVEIQIFQMPDGEFLWRLDGGMKEYITKSQFYFKDIYQVQVFSTKCTEPLAKTIKN